MACLRFFVTPSAKYMHKHTFPCYKKFLMLFGIDREPGESKRERERHLPYGPCPSIALAALLPRQIGRVRCPDF